jgi:hypothetical protein
VLDALWGETHDSTLRRFVFGPLGMASSDLVWRAEWEADCATCAGEDGAAREPWRPDAPNAAYSLHAPAADYARLLAAYLDPALRARFPDVYTPQSGVNGLLSWTLGWGYAEGEDGRRTLWQWGDNPGFKAFAVLEPDADAGLVVFTNADTGQRVCRHLVHRLLGIDHPAFAWRNIRM